MIELRPATDDDKAFLTSLNKASYEEVVSRQCGRWDDREQEQRFEEKWRHHQYQILMVSGERVGVMWVSTELDHIWLRELQIVPAERNSGLGTQVLKQLVRDARSQGMPVRLRVLTQNRARRLYERIGFKFVGMSADTHDWMEHSG